MTKFTTPILFLIWRRPDTTQQVFNAIRQVKPKYLFVAADGPRENNPKEQEQCLQTRKIIEQIDWQCELKTLFRDKNLGCKLAVSSAISWFFETVEEGIILEDDTLPNKSFFWFCEELLKKYRDNQRIFYISGTNLLEDKIRLRRRESYFFCKYGSLWGWATWKRVWKYYDAELTQFPEFKSKKDKIKLISKNKMEQIFWLDIFEMLYQKKVDTWDYQFHLPIIIHNGLGITPTKNLVVNIGFDKNPTHYHGIKYNQTFSDIQDIIHPKTIKVNSKADKLFFKTAFLWQIPKSPTQFIILKNKISAYIPAFIKNFIKKIFNKNPKLIYKPRKFEKPPHLIDVPSAWKGLELIIHDIIKRFKIPTNSCLEFGVEYGYSTAVFANYFKKVIGIDLFTGDIHSTYRQNFYEETKKNLAQFKNIQLIQSDYKEWINKDENHYDLIHVDIVHTYEDTHNCGLWSVKHSKCTLFHDTETFPEVKRAVLDIVKNTGKKFYNYPLWHGLGIVI